MAVAFGGAALLAAVAWDRAAGVERARAVVAVAARYEWAFWLAIGLLAMTGVGNVAAFGAALPAPSSSWGAIFIVKLVFVIAAATLSVPRTIAISLLGSEPNAVPERVLETVRFAYVATSLALATILALALWLAHG
jgi:hypothetical protein